MNGKVLARLLRLLKRAASDQGPEGIIAAQRAEVFARLHGVSVQSVDITSNLDVVEEVHALGEDWQLALAAATAPYAQVQVFGVHTQGSILVVGAPFDVRRWEELFTQARGEIQRASHGDDQFAAGAARGFHQKLQDWMDTQSSRNLPVLASRHEAMTTYLASRGYKISTGEAGTRSFDDNVLRGFLHGYNMTPKNRNLE